MSVGSLSLRVVLDQPTKIHCGNQEPVTGYVAVTFQNSAKYPVGELFGPLRLEVLLHGRCKTKVWKRQGQNTHIYRGRVQLFHIPKIIHNDQFRSQTGQTQRFPFSINFPATAQPGYDADWDPNGTFQSQDLLPPSFREDSQGFTHHYESFVEYRIGASARMPNIQVEIKPQGKYEEPVVFYERPRIPAVRSMRPIEWPGQVVVSNELLLPPEKRPTGFKQKMKVAFTSNNFPSYAFSWKVSGPQVVHVLEPVVFHIAIKPIERGCTAPLVPDVLLTRFVLEIKGNTEVRAERMLFSHPETSSCNTLATLGSTFVNNKMIFSKANDWTKTLRLGTLTDLPSQFSTPNIRRSYTMEIKVNFEVAGVNKSFHHSVPLNIVPPLQESGPAVGPSGVAPETEFPATEVAVAGPSGGMNADDTVLPQYEPPPTYEADEKA